jgi:hypothetical protein
MTIAEASVYDAGAGLDAQFQDGVLREDLK